MKKTLITCAIVVIVTVLLIICLSIIPSEKRYTKIGQGKLGAYTYTCAIGKYDYTGFWVLDGKPCTAQYGFNSIGFIDIPEKLDDTPSLNVGDVYYIYQVSSLQGVRIVITKDKPSWWD